MKRELYSLVMFKTVWLSEVMFTGKNIELTVGACDSFMNSFQFIKHAANIKREGLNDGNFNARGCFIYDCSNIERTFELMDRSLWTFLLTSDLLTYSYGTFHILNSPVVSRGIAENGAFSCQSLCMDVVSGNLKSHFRQRVREKETFIIFTLQRRI